MKKVFLFLLTFVAMVAEAQTKGNFGNGITKYFCKILHHSTINSPFNKIRHSWNTPVTEVATAE